VRFAINSSWSHSAKVVLCLLVPVFAAFAAEVESVESKYDSIEHLTALTWVFIIGFSVLGWAVSELDKLAELWDTEGKKSVEIWRYRLTLVRDILGSIGAGIFVFFMGRITPGWMVSALGASVAKAPEIPEMLLFIGVAVAGYSGSKIFNWIQGKVLK
jgi:hypothetical protein